MAKEYKTIAATIPDLEKLITGKAKENVQTKLTEESLKDANRSGFAPKQDGTLVNQSILATDFIGGELIYGVPYAFPRWLSNITGIPEWADVSETQQKGTRIKQISAAIDIEKDKIFR